MVYRYKKGKELRRDGDADAIGYIDCSGGERRRRETGPHAKELDDDDDTARLATVAYDAREARDGS